MTTSRNIPAGTVRLTRRLYDSIQEHHENCLQMLFIGHYQSLPDGTQDRLWVTRLTPYETPNTVTSLCGDTW